MRESVSERLIGGGVRLIDLREGSSMSVFGDVIGRAHLSGETSNTKNCQTHHPQRMTNRRNVGQNDQGDLALFPKVLLERLGDLYAMAHGYLC